MKAIGYDVVVDYTKTNFTKSGAIYDLILDGKSNQYLWSYLRALSPNGKYLYLTIGGNPRGLIQILLLAFPNSLKNEKFDFFTFFLRSGHITG